MDSALCPLESLACLLQRVANEPLCLVDSAAALAPSPMTFLTGLCRVFQFKAETEIAARRLYSVLLGRVFEHGVVGACVSVMVASKLNEYAPPALESLARLGSTSVQALKQLEHAALAALLWQPLLVSPLDFGALLLYCVMPAHEAAALVYSLVDVVLQCSRSPEFLVSRTDSVAIECVAVLLQRAGKWTPSVGQCLRELELDLQEKARAAAPQLAQQQHEQFLRQQREQQQRLLEQQQQQHQLVVSPVTTSSFPRAERVAGVALKGQLLSRSAALLEADDSAVGAGDVATSEMGEPDTDMLRCSEIDVPPSEE